MERRADTERDGHRLAFNRSFNEKGLDDWNWDASKMSLSADSCIAIEDSQHGLQAATALGIKTVITVNDYTQSEDFSEAILVLNHLGEAELPFNVISGDVVAAGYLNLDLLRQLHNK